MAKKTYVVKPGDNLLKLSEEFNVPVEELQSANGINSLTPGQTIRVPVQKSKGQAWVNDTEENKTITRGGENVRLPSNSYLAPKQDDGFLNQLNNFLFPQDTSGNFGGVRGAVPESTGGGGKQASLSANALGGIGGVGSSVGAVTNPWDQSGSVPTFAPAPPTTIPQGGMSGDKQGFVPAPAGQFSYAPQGYNSYTPYSIPPPPSSTFVQPAYTVASGVNKDPRTGVSPNAIAMNNARYYGFLPPITAAPAAPTQQPGMYGNYAEGNKLYSGQAKTQQEAFQQGDINVSKRGWIKSTSPAKTAEIRAQKILWRDQINAKRGRTTQVNNVQQGTWRV